MANHSSAASDESPHPASGARRVFYFVDESTTAIAYAEGHFMRPSRIRVLHSLVKSLGLDHFMTVCAAQPASPRDLRLFHSAAYTHCLRESARICGDPLEPAALAYQKEFGVPVLSQTSDCPLFPEVWQLVESQAGASLACADALIDNVADVAINWAGGMHHGAAARASGFCFVNDIALCIGRLLRRFQRVLYVDLDVHHGDGVESAFLGNPRVLTFSMHQWGDGFFPGTGGPSGADASGMALNAPLPPRTGDAAYLLYFRTALRAIRCCFDPEVVVVQCGADTIVGDLIGRLCVTTTAHTQCTQDVLDTGLPVVLLGGGGYHVFHTAKCWAIHTAVAVGRREQLPTYVPHADPYYSDYRREMAPMRPTLHVHLDPAVDEPLALEAQLAAWHEFCNGIKSQMRHARHLRESFLRTVHLAQQWASGEYQGIKSEAGAENDAAPSDVRGTLSNNRTRRQVRHPPPTHGAEGQSEVPLPPSGHATVLKRPKAEGSND